jgi:predicted outer membrane protein
VQASDDACSKADKVKVPADLDKEHQAKLNALKAAGKSAFDKIYMADRLTAHESAWHCFLSMRLMRRRGTESLRKTAPTPKEHWAEAHNVH